MTSRHSDVTGIVARYPIAAFLVWFFTVGQALAFAPVYLDVGVADQWFVIASTLIGLLLPTIVITRMTDGPAGVRDLGRRIVKLDAPWTLYAVGLLAMPLLAIALAVVLLGAPAVPTSTAVTAIAGGLVVTTVVGFALTNLWEEVAWMGFVQARLQHRHGAMRAAAITAPLFALQHTALAVGGNGPIFAVMVLTALAVLSVPFRAFCGWVYNRSNGSLFLVGLVHALSNAVGPGTGLSDGYLRHLYPGDAELVGVVHIVALAIIGLIAIAITRGWLGLPGRPSRATRSELDVAAGVR